MASERMNPQTAKGLDQPQPVLFATFAPLRFENDRDPAARPFLAATIADHCAQPPCHPQRLEHETAKTQSAQRTQLNLSKSKQRQVTSQRLRPQPRETDEAPQSHPVVQNALFATFASLRLEIDRATRTRPPLEATTTPPIQPPVQNVLFATFAPLRFTSDRATHTMPTLAVKPADHHEVWLCQRQRLEIRTAKAQRAQERTPVFPPDPFAVHQEIA